MPATETLVRGRIKAIVEAEFNAPPLDLTVEDDRLADSLGRDGAPRAACSPIRAVEDPKNVKVLIVEATLQIFLAWDAIIDEEQSVDPSAIEDVAGRLRAAFGPEQFNGGSDDLWFLRIRRIEYPNDPTGNKTRLEAEVVGKATNQAAQSV